MTKQKIENIIKRSFGQWTPQCRLAACAVMDALKAEQAKTLPAAAKANAFYNNVPGSDDAV